MAKLPVGARERDAADRQIVTFGLVYPDAIDIRTALPRGLPDPGPPNEPAASDPQPHAPADQRNSAGGET